MKKTLIGSLFFILSLGGIVFALSVCDQSGVLPEGEMVVTLRSSVMTNFKIHICHAPTCIEVGAGLGLVSLDGKSLSAKNAEIEIQSTLNKKVSCADLRFGLQDQFIVCDNRELPQTASLTMDADFNVRDF